MKYLNFSLVLIGLFTLQACGVEIHDSHSRRSDYVSYKIYELHPSGATEFIYGDCIDLDSYYDENGSTLIETTYTDEELLLSWDRYGDSISFTFEDDFRLISKNTYSTYFFRTGSQQELVFDSGYTEYLVSLEGPSCF